MCKSTEHYKESKNKLVFLISSLKRKQTKQKLRGSSSRSHLDHLESEMMIVNLLGEPTLSESFLQKELSSNVEIVIMCGVFHVSHALLEGEKDLRSMKQLE